MQCQIQAKDSAELLLRYCSRRLDPDQTSLLERHMESCESCRSVAETQKALWTALDSWEAMPISTTFDQRLYRRIEAEHDGSWWRMLLRPLYVVSWRPAVPLAAACVTMLAIFLLNSPPAVEYRPRPAETVDMEQVERTLEDLEMLKLITPASTTVTEAQSTRSL